MAELEGLTSDGTREVTRAKYCISLRKPFQGMEPLSPIPIDRVAATIKVSSTGCIVDRFICTWLDDV